MKSKRYLLLSLKWVITLAALWYVVSKVPFGELWQLVKGCQPGWLVAALCLFLLSKLGSAYRLNYFFSASGIFLHTGENIKLYWLGMFYNQFLPGGIGGDAYKAFWIGKELGQSTTLAAKVILWDRLSGLVALLVLLGCMVAGLYPSWGFFVAIPLGIFAYVLYFHVPTRWKVLPNAGKTVELFSWWVQLCQCACAFCLLRALHLEASYLPYLAAFLFSSMVSVVPLTVGGIGARELAFLVASNWWGLHQEIAVGLGFLFYAVTMVSSLGGAVYALSPSSSIRFKDPSPLL